MKSPHCVVGAVLIGCAGLVLQACGGGGSDSDLGGTFTSVGSEGLTAGPALSLEFKPGGTVEMAASGAGSSSGTYTVDGEKIIVSIDNQQHTFIRDGNCLEEQRQFKLTFKPGDTLSLSMTRPDGSPDTQEGTFTIEGDKIYATLAQSTPMVLMFVNGAYESTAFGLPMKFVRQ